MADFASLFNNSEENNNKETLPILSWYTIFTQWPCAICGAILVAALIEQYVDSEIVNEYAP